jgi:DNA-binding CsgD family transcriptional regulator
MADDPEAKFLDALYFGAKDSGIFDRAIGLLADQFDCASATVVDFDAVTPEISLACVAGFDPEFLRLYQEQFASIDPAPPAFATGCPSGKASSTNRMFTEEELKKGVFANEWLRPAGYEETMAGVLTAREGRFAMVGLQRTPRREAFSDADIAKLEVLLPHLARALELRRAFLGLERKAGILSDACDRLAAGVVVLDEGGRSVFVNEAARRISTRNDGLALDRQGHLFALDRTANQRLAEMQRDLASGGSGGVVRASRRDGSPPYILIVGSLFLDDGIERRSRPRGTIFVIHDPLDKAPVAPDVIAAMFGLPQGAARVVAALAAGQELKAYAEEAGISMNTVHFHLKTAFLRTGTHSQTQLMKLAVAALRDLLDHRG